MKKCFLLIAFCLVSLSLAWAEPFLSTQGPIMEKTEEMSLIVVNERSIVVAPSTQITDQKGRDRRFRHLKPGRWVLVEAEPDEDSRMVATRIVLIRKK